MDITALAVITIITIIITIADGLILAEDTEDIISKIIITGQPTLIAGIDQQILTVGTGQHRTLTGIGRHTIITAAGAVIITAAIIITIMGDTADTAAIGGLAGKL